MGEHFLSQIRVIAVDIDGTLTNREKQITPRTLQALLQAQKQGITLVLASGRPISGLKKYSVQLHLPEYGGNLISFNGGLLADAKTNEVLYEQKMPLPIAIEVLRHLQQFPVTVMLCDGDQLVVEDINGYQVEYEANCNHLRVTQTDSLEEYLYFSPYKLLASANPPYLSEIHEQLAAPFTNRLSTFFSAPFFFEFVPLGVNKANALQRLCQMRGIRREEVLCFGDEQNDLEMIRFAGHGVAMGNACDLLKQAADEITLSNDEDGIAVVVERYLA